MYKRQHNNHHKEPKGKFDVSEAFEGLWKEINPKLLKSRQGGKSKAKTVFTRIAKETDPKTLGAAVAAFYSDPDVKKEGYKYAPAILVCLNKENYAGYMGEAATVPPSVMRELYDKRDAGEITQEQVEAIAAEYQKRAA